MQTLKLGNFGIEVKTLQNLLSKHGYYCGVVDGIFGKRTEEQVKKFQQDHNLKSDGIVGNLTWTSLFSHEQINEVSSISVVEISKFKTATIIKTHPKNIEIVVSNKSFNQTISKNLINGTYFWQGNPNGILVNDGKILCSYASHAWRGYAQSTLYYTKDEVIGIKKIKTTNELTNIDWAIGGLGMITNYGYDPNSEGFNGNYADVLRKTNKTVIGYKNGDIYLIVVPNISHTNLLSLLIELGLQLSISLDGGGSSCMRANGQVIMSTERIINNWVRVI